MVELSDYSTDGRGSDSHREHLLGVIETWDSIREPVHTSSMNTAVFKTLGFWVALVTSSLGVLLSQHVVMDGSTLAAVIGWIMTFGGSVGAGHQLSVASRE